MSLSEPLRREISELASAAIDGRLDDAGQSRLESILLASPEARACYVRFMGISAGLAWAARGANPAAVPAPHRVPRVWRPAWRPVWAAAAVLALAALGAWLAPQKPPAPARPDAGVATLTNAVNLEWDQSQEPRHVRNVLKPGWLRLKSGLAQIEFISGTSVWLEGPAAFRLDSAKQGFFESGRMLAEVPHGSDGFRVDFPLGTVVDRGTAFGVEVRTGQATVHVFDGAVAVTAGGGTGTYAAGQALTVDDRGNLRVGASDARAFDEGAYGWGGDTFGPLVPGFGPARWPRHGPWDSTWRGWDQLEYIRGQLGLDADRWEAIKPEMSGYLQAQWELKCQGLVSEDNDFSRAAWDLWYGAQNPDATDEDLGRRLAAVREARQEVRTRRDEAETELRDLLTLREEAMLVDMGYMQ